MTKTVMVVDDEEDNRSTVKAVLERNGYKVITAISGDDCLSLLSKKKDNPPDVILLDIMMPGTPTREVVKKLKSYKIAYLTVVRMTEAEKEELLKQKNIVDFIQKPFDIQNLIQRVKKITG